MSADAMLGLTEDQVPVLTPSVRRIFTLHERCCALSPRGRPDWKCGRGRIVGYELSR